MTVDIYETRPRKVYVIQWTGTNIEAVEKFAFDYCSRSGGEVAWIVRNCGDDSLELYAWGKRLTVERLSWIVQNSWDLYGRVVNDATFENEHRQRGSLETPAPRHPNSCF